MTSALISAAVALLIFTWTQWISGMRSRHDLLRTKLEELCRLVFGLRSKIGKAATTISLPADVEQQQRVLSEFNQGIGDDSLMIQMLAGLYFPKLATHVSNIVSCAESCVGHREFMTKPPHYQILINTQALKLLNVNIVDLMRFVNLEYLQLTESPRSKVSELKEKILL